MSQIYDIRRTKIVQIHRKVLKDLLELEFSLKRELAELFGQLAEGESLGLPVSRPMTTIDHGVHELRVKDSSGQYRVFYYTKKVDAILVFHFFKKKTQKTPDRELRTARNRLREML